MVAAAALAALSLLEQINTTLVPGIQLLTWKYLSLWLLEATYSSSKGVTPANLLKG